MGVVSFISDKLVNLVANIGTDRDKASASFYATPVMTDEQIHNMYRGSWVARKIIDIPPLDATRKWRLWQAEGDQIEKIEALEKMLGYRAKVREAKTKGDLFGGAAIYIGSNDNRPDLPLDPKRGVKYMTVLLRRELKPTEIENDVLSPRYGQPRGYTPANKPGLLIHPSRLIMFAGVPIPDQNFVTDKGWGDSRLLAIREAIMQQGDTMANIASLVFEAKVDIIKVPELMTNLQNDKTYQGRLTERFSLAATMKGINGTLVMDTDEEYVTTSANFGTLPDIADRFLQAVAGAADIPATRLLGQSPAGMNATGDSDTRNYYDRIQSMQELELGPAMALADECIIWEALQARPPEIHYIWASLWQVSATEAANIGKVKAETLKTLSDSGLFNPDALSQAGATMLVEGAVIPGLEAAIDEFGTLPDEPAGDPAVPPDNEDAADA